MFIAKKKIRPAQVVYLFVIFDKIVDAATQRVRLTVYRFLIFSPVERILRRVADLNLRNKFMPNHGNIIYQTFINC